MYGQPGATFSPGGSSEGSPLHQAHPQNVAAGSYPMPPQSVMGVPGGPPGGPVSMGMPPVQPGTAMPGQVPYTQGMSSMAAPPSVNPAAQYVTQPPGGYQPPQNVYNPAGVASQPPSMPQQPQQPGYQIGQQPIDYGAYNMQSKCICFRFSTCL